MGQTTSRSKPGTALLSPRPARARPAKRPGPAAAVRKRRKRPVPRKSPARAIAGFYDRLAGTYDSMTNFEHRFLREGQMLRMLVVKNGFRTALDAGCGTGFHALYLARLGVRVTAVDLSAKMLKRVAAHAREMGVRVATIRCGFTRLAGRVRRRVDAIFCMGNTLAHLRSGDELRRTLTVFASLLNTGGFLVLQLLNFDRIVKLGSLPQIVRETPAGVFTRTYDLTDEGVRLTIEHRAPGKRTGVRQALDMRPVYHTELLTGLEKAGFGEIEIFGSIEMEPFDPAASNDIVVVARK